MNYRVAAFAFLLAAAHIAFGADTNFAVRLDCELQTAGPASLKDVNWTQGQTPLMELRVLRNGRPVVADTNTSVRMLFAASSTATTYAVATNYWPATNAASYFVQWGAIGTNTAGTGTTAQAWWYTVYFDKISTGETYWSGNGAIYIEKSTSLADGLNWIDATNLPRVAWANVLGDPADNASLVAYLEATAGEDAVARAAAASNAAEIAIMSTGKLDAATAATTYQPTGSYVRAGSGLGTRLWVDAASNYYATSENGSNSFTSTSFSAAFNWAVTNARTTSIYTPIITIGSSLTDGGGRYYEIDAPISIGSSIGPFALTLRGAGNIGTTISPKAGYNGQMFVFASNISSIVRFESIRFQANSSANTNPVIDSRAAESVFVDCEWTGFRGSAIRHSGYPPGGAWNRIESCLFIGNSNDYPLIDLSGTAYDWMITDCHFSKHAATTADIIRVDGDLANVQVHGSRFTYTGTSNDAAVCAVNLIKGTGFVGSDNTFHGFPLASHLFRFAPAASNSYRSLVAGNNVGNSFATNFVFISTNAHDVDVLFNQVDGVGRSTVAYTTNSAGVWVYNVEEDGAETDPVWTAEKSGYATGTPVYVETDPIFSATNAWLVRTNDSAYTATVANAASAVQPADTNGWVVSSHSGLATEAQAGQIATNVATSYGFAPTSSVQAIAGQIATNVSDAAIAVSNIAEGTPQALALADGFVTIWSTGLWEQAYTAAGAATVRVVKANASNSAAIIWHATLSNFPTFFITNNLLGFTATGISTNGETTTISLRSKPGSTNWTWSVDLP